MIISSAKPFNEVLNLLNNTDNIFVIGCSTCAAKLKLGGETELIEMCNKLKDAGKNVVGWLLPTAACSVKSYHSLVEKNPAIEKADSILVMACGSGTSIISRFVNVPVYPANNTDSLGGKSEDKIFLQVCKMCGNCNIQTFGGICPKANCPKGLLNGPCGGSMQNKCEVNSEKDCAWELIYNQLENIKKLNLLEKIIEPAEYKP